MKPLVLDTERLTCLDWRAVSPVRTITTEASAQSDSGNQHQVVFLPQLMVTVRITQMLKI